MIITHQPLAKGPQNPYSCIPLTHPSVVRAMELIPSEYWGNTWVAGSAATRFGQHNDVDVWVTEVPRTRDLWTVLPINAKKDPMTVEDEEYEQLCVKVFNNADEKLQIMALHETIQQLLYKFDISVHCGAVNVITGEQLKGDNYSEKVTISNFMENSPILTLGRYITFAKRYKDFTGSFDQNVQTCAAAAFNLKTDKQMQDMLQYCYIDKGL